MSKVILILGPAGSGKTRLLNKLTQSKKSLHLEETHLKSAFAFSQLKPDHSYIAIDEAKHLETVRLFTSGDLIMVEQRGQKGHSVPCPTVIITSSQIDKVPTIPGVKVIRLDVDEQVKITYEKHLDDQISQAERKVYQAKNQLRELKAARHSVVEGRNIDTASIQNNIGQSVARLEAYRRGLNQLYNQKFTAL